MADSVGKRKRRDNAETQSARSLAVEEQGKISTHGHGRGAFEKGRFTVMGKRKPA
jgi:hypothetical protein